MMPEWVGESDDDETIEPWFNEAGGFGEGDYWTCSTGDLDEDV